MTLQQLYVCDADYGSKQIKFSGKHEFYDLMIKVTVDPNVWACYVLPPYPGSVNDIKIS